MEEFGIPGFGIRNPRRGIQNAGMSLKWDDKAMLSPQVLGETGIH